MSNLQLRIILAGIAGIIIGVLGSFIYMWNDSKNGVEPYIVEGYSTGANYNMEAIGVASEPGEGGNGYVIAGASWREFGGPWHSEDSPPSLEWPSYGQKVRLAVIDYKPLNGVSGGSRVLWYEVIDTTHMVQKGFGIYLADTGKRLLSENEIKNYDAVNYTFELNEGGIQKWNSYQTYEDIPKLAESLFNKDFIIRIEGQEICRGKFWSGLSSSSYNGIIITEALFKLNENHNTIQVRADYPGTNTPANPEINRALTAYFKSLNLLK